mmetsp:Transcript_16243/g.50423  ORF Transcript_16243/g.50423 Transcript_16243/m.50423 type:complete len:430 (+) Transcript_16243:281-1570(+)
MPQRRATRSQGSCELPLRSCDSVVSRGRVAVHSLIGLLLLAVLFLLFVVVVGRTHQEPGLERVVEQVAVRAVLAHVRAQLLHLLRREQQRLEVRLEDVRVKVLPDESEQLVRHGVFAARLRDHVPRAAAVEAEDRARLRPDAEHRHAPGAADAQVTLAPEEVAVPRDARRLALGGHGGLLGEELAVVVGGGGRLGLRLAFVLVDGGVRSVFDGVGVTLALRPRDDFHLRQEEVLRDPRVQALRVERHVAPEHHGRHAVLQGLGHVLDPRLDVLHPVLLPVGEVEREVPGVQDLRQRHLGPRRRDHGGGRRDGADERRELVELRLAVGLRDEVDLVEDDDVGELELVDEERRDVAVVLRLLRLGIDRGDGVDAPHVLLEGARVDDGDAVVERADGLQHAGLRLDKEGLGHLHRLRDPAALDEHAVVLAGR